MYLHRKDTATGGYMKVGGGFESRGEQDITITKDPSDKTWRLIIEEVV